MDNNRTSREFLSQRSSRGDEIPPGQLPQDFAKFFYSRCHVTLCDAGEHRVGSQMTEVSRLLTRLRRAKEVRGAVRAFANHVTV